MKVTLSAIREHYRNISAHDDARIWPKWSRGERVEKAVAQAQIEAKEAEEYERDTVAAASEQEEEIFYLNDREGSPEDDYEGELPW